MPSDALDIRSAWNSIPYPDVVDSQVEQFTAKRMERILAIVTAVGSTALGVQGLVAAQNGVALHDTFQLSILIGVYISLAAMVVACVVGKGVRVTAGTFAVVYVAALLSWPWVVQSGANVTQTQPWIFFLVNVGVVAAMLAFRLALQLLWAIGIPIIYGYVRMVQGGFSANAWAMTSFDVTFTLCLGLVLIALAWMFRSVAAGVDEARGTAVAAYVAAAAVAVAEEERIAMSALMHDSVLAALIAAERADEERTRALAVDMAREALTRLANAEAALEQEGSDEPIGTAQIAQELRRAVAEMAADAAVDERGGVGLIPGRAARAIVLAARQAISNAIDHADAKGLHIVVNGDGDEGVTVTVSDTGPGFQVDDIDEDRLGVRASIYARMAGVAGFVTIDAGDEGTKVLLGWKRE